MAAFKMSAPRTAAWVLGLGLLALAGAARAADPAKPYMEVVFEIQSPTFRRALPEVPMAEATLAQKLADEFARRHRFADWLSAPRTGAPMGQLIARLVEVEAHPFNQVLVTWFVKTPSGSVEALPLQPVEIYPPTNNNWDAGNRQRFETHVFGKIVEVIQVQGFQDATFQDVLSKLPIATSVMPVDSDRVIIVPLLWKHLRLGQDSELLVKFTSASPQGAPHQGSLTLSRINERSRGHEGIGFVQGGIREGMLDTQVLPLTAQWNPALATLLNKATVRCFITAFKLAEFDDGVVRDPSQ
jgi:hypothetical protein